MPRYILIDSHSGYIFADLEAKNMIEAARRCDHEHVREFNRTYVEGRHGNGYEVWQADAAMPKVTDGQDQKQIEAAQMLCRRIGFVTYIRGQS